eukprot:TRINITY_DN1261_c0_g1_i1.p1 TRINITY_DN1261_c0_g1~~TRINITY_DN1261_c0_g1_i1.p1  ORF type:complete len:185 (+),score=21.27 TRINITY_DN1261_c0_g1_i1:132-686(+)
MKHVTMIALVAAVIAVAHLPVALAVRSNFTVATRTVKDRCSGPATNATCTQKGDGCQWCPKQSNDPTNLEGECYDPKAAVCCGYQNWDCYYPILCDVQEGGLCCLPAFQCEYGGGPSCCKPGARCCGDECCGPEQQCCLGFHRGVCCDGAAVCCMQGASGVCCANNSTCNGPTGGCGPAPPTAN